VEVYRGCGDKQRSNSLSGHFIPVETAHGSHWVQGWVDLKARVAMAVKIKCVLLLFL